ncbi:helix-turn-helix domain-containing protein [Chitinophaga barathri]|uniref:AraC family transcriptional regulator n=1 Tax=Chitinophaga barathri TaxID=1647451 RepID=A0A3N4MBI6_9BACT|nr:AraC family transcriptional regulator [Chitinophaga barathri]RPD39146.1 AraC family transcriptional regulator [Chitinophaga barathri]
MKPELLKVPTREIHSFSARRDMLPNINSRWHYHDELELIHFQKGHGMQFVGDDIRAFSPGDIVLVGSNLPHFWRYENTEGDSADIPYSTVIHFKETCLGGGFLDIPEASSIRGLIQRAKRGLHIAEHASAAIVAEMNRLVETDGIERIVALLRCLAKIAMHPGVTELASPGFRPVVNQSAGSERINRVFDHIFKNFQEPLSLPEVAGIAMMSENSFCRYFKSKTGKTYLQFLYEVRVGFACKLLMDNRLSIKEICFASGFNDYTSFHRIFKKHTGKTPQQYFKTILP